MDRKSLNKLFKHYQREEDRAWKKATKAANTGNGWETAHAAYKQAVKMNNQITDKYA